ncbi:MAG: hypothetical protein AAF790_15460, partial [Planctomycetota bacterium]
GMPMGGMGGRGGRGGRGGGMGMGGMGMGGMPMGGMGGRGSSEPGAYAAPHLMVRFLDFGVRPGRRYKYRFKLVLLDVNARGQVRPVFLDKEVLKRVGEKPLTTTPIITTDWSEPSSEISIPLQGSVLVAGAQQRAGGDTTASLIVQSFDIDDKGKAMQAGIEQDKVRPGSVMNMAERGVEILISPFLEKVESFKFRTGVTVLDIDGGKKLSGKMTAPARVLTMDASGRLRVRSQLTDYAAVERHRDIYAEEDDRGRGGRGGRGGGGGGDDMMGGFDMGF